MKQLTAGKLSIKIYDDRTEMGADAAHQAAERIRMLLNEKDVVNCIFAAAASQNEFLEALTKEDIEWNRVNAFHMDEYIGLSEHAPQQFGIFLKERIFDKVPFKKVYYLNSQAVDIQAECKRYSELLTEFPVDITFMGIGENSHLAFNDPHVADFKDPYLVKVVDLDEACKQQQVNEGCFAHVSEIPLYAYTLTIPALMKAAYIFCMVPGATKAVAVRHTLTDSLSEKYPSTILRTHPNAILFLEKESAAEVIPEIGSLEKINYN
jgi:glucosamine-6-phosphate deaminase